MNTTDKTAALCAVCIGRENRGFEVRPCDTGYGCPYQHFGYRDPVEIEAASVRNTLKTRGVRE